jgi:hypothetical protein
LRKDLEMRRSQLPWIGAFVAIAIGVLVALGII